MKVKVKYHDPNMPKLEKISKGDWIDLRVIEGGTTLRDGVKFKNKWTEELVSDTEGRAYIKKVLHYKKDDFIMLNLGVTIAPENGWELYLAPRSSTFKNYGFLQTNSWGVGDNSFRGNNDIYHMPVLATRDGKIELYDRVAQFRLVESMPYVAFLEVEDTGYDDREGFGSTGVK